MPRCRPCLARPWMGRALRACRAARPGRGLGLGLLLGAGLLGACALPPAPQEASGSGPVLVTPDPAAAAWADPVTRANEAAADRLLDAARAAGLGPDSVLLVASLSPLDDLQRSSPLGRLVAEQVGSRLAQQGLGVKELRLREGLLLRPAEGELMLSREAAELARQHQAQAVLLGSYTRSREASRISLRLVRLDDARVLAATSYALAIDEATERLPPAGAAPGEGAAAAGAEPPAAASLYEAIRAYDRSRPPLR